MESYGPLLVTGASTGIGRATSEMLAQRGHLVYAGARKSKDLNDLGTVPSILPIRLDVTKPKDVANAVEFVEKEGRGLYGLVNNAGVWHEWPLAESTDDDLYETFEVNVMGLHRVTKAMLPFLVKAKGRIVNLSSISGFVSTQWSGAYEMSKHAVESYSDTLALNLNNYGVVVSMIEPGTYRTRIGPRGLEGTRKRVESRVPVLLKSEIPARLKELEKEVDDEKNYPTPEEVAEAILDALFSARPKRRYMPCPNRKEFVSTIESPIRRATQANLGGGRFSLARKEVHDLLDRIWDEETKP